MLSNNPNPLLLLPAPRSITYHGGRTSLADHQLIVIPGPAQLFAAQWLQKALAQHGLRWDIVTNSNVLPAASVGIFLALQSHASDITSDKNSYQDVSRRAASLPADQHYTLTIATAQIALSGSISEALWYGVCTLAQIIAQGGGTLPLLTIDDMPDFARRGVMLDISRDKVPTMDTLFMLIDKLASWKINEVQLYTEHTFAYQQHRVVWQDASPMTAQEIMELDRFCNERFIDLVPNQNSFGHMHHWLMHDEYRDLAEYPEGFDWPMFLTARPFSLAAADPRSLQLIGGLYEELLPNFSSRYFNIGCDETFDLGRGRSAELVEQIGKGQVYLDYVTHAAALAEQHGRTPMFWGDIIIDYPDLIPKLPKDMIALEWGYDAAHPFDRDGERFAASNIPFYVCPGTSSWLSLVGRTTNAIGNLQNAAENGKKYGARGYLITDWGDYGHWQPLSASYMGFAYGAALSWAHDANRELDIPAALSHFAFADSTGTMGRIAYQAGDVYRIVNDYPQFNGAVMVRALFTPLEKIWGDGGWLASEKGPTSFDHSKIRAAMDEMEKLMSELDTVQTADPAIVPEYRLAMRLWLHGCKRLLIADPDPSKRDSSITLPALATEIRGLLADYRERWLARNRPGGLNDSAKRMERLLAEYEA